MNIRPLQRLLPLAALALVACATQETPADRAAGAGASLQKAAEAPLADLNLVQKKIPPVLEAAVHAPYAPPPERSCAALAGEVQALDAALGPDLDTPPTPADPGLVARGVGMLGDAANDALRGAAESVIPFRGWVRRLDGAERHSKAVAAAVAAGSVRRAYLKGLGQALSCAAPAAPRSALAAPAPAALAPAASAPAASAPATSAPAASALAASASAS